MSVGENIRRYRKSHGMTQAQLAEAVGLTEGAVRHYESGIRAVKPELLESIAAALGAQSRDGDRVVGREARTARERRDRRRRVRGLESLAVTAPRISQSTQPNQDARLGGELRSLLRKLSFYSPLHAKAFQA